MVWEYLFDDDLVQRRDIEMLKADAAASDTDNAILRQRMAKMQMHIDKLEMALEAVVRVLEKRRALTRDEISVMTQWIDLADGVEDGRMGPDRTADAPLCSSCGRPINPKRDACIYCNEPIVIADDSVDQPEAPPRLVTCSACGRQIPERDSYFGDSGLVCGSCFHG